MVTNVNRNSGCTGVPTIHLARNLLIDFLKNAIDDFCAEKLEKNNGEKMFVLDRFILPESTFCYF